jgi:hypothetical protein
MKTEGKKLLRLLYHNSLLRMALGISLYAVVIIILIVPIKFAVVSLKILFFFILFLVVLALIQELLFLRSKGAKYLDLALLLRETRELEHILTLFGAKGKGLYDKTVDLFAEDEALLEEILMIANARNKAMHGDGRVENIKQLLKKSREIKRFFLSHISLVNKIFHYVADASVVLYSLYLTFVVYHTATHSIGKLLLALLLFFELNKFLRLLFDDKWYIALLFLSSIFTVLMIVKNGLYWDMVMNGVQSVF